MTVSGSNGRPSPSADQKESRPLRCGLSKGKQMAVSTCAMDKHEEIKRTVLFPGERRKRDRPALTITLAMITKSERSIREPMGHTA